MTLSLPPPALRRVGPQVGIRVDRHLNPRVDARGQLAARDHLQRAFTLDPAQVYPVCVAYQGDSPVEYPSEEDPEEPAPFRLTDVNRMLAALTR